jgi:hypothetical protein
MDNLESLCGSTLALASNSLEASPRPVRSSGAGTRSRAGRLSVSARAAVNSAFVTGCGAVRFTGPSMSS